MACENLTWSENIRYKKENSFEIPKRAGVYEVSVALKDSDDFGSLYVGETDDLNRRYLEHLSEEEENECLKENLSKYKCYFRYALVSTQQDREDAEDHLLEIGEYECNEEDE